MNRRIVLRAAVYLALFVCFTALFMVANYPAGRLTDQVSGWVASTTRGAVAVDDVRFQLPLSLKVGEVFLRSGPGDRVDLGTAVVTPQLLGMFAGDRGADIHLENPWLVSDLRVLSSGESLDLDVHTARVVLSQLPPEVVTLPVNLDGDVDLVLKVTLAEPSGNIQDGEVTVKSKAVEFSGSLLKTLGLSPLTISRVTGTATIKDNVVTLGENTVKGDINAAASGSIQLVPADYLRSRLDLAVELKPDPGKREKLVPLFTLMGARVRGDGTINLRVRGTVGNPAVTM